MAGKICYLGDDHLQGAAAYLAAVLLHYGLAFDHVPTAEPPPADFISRPYAVYVVSDYSAACFGEANMRHVAARVEQGAGLVMFGGWQSFYGPGRRVSPVAAGGRASGGDAIVRRSSQPARNRALLKSWRTTRYWPACRGMSLRRFAATIC